MEFIDGVIKQVPALGVMAFIVWVFLRHMETRDKSIRDIHNEHIIARSETRIVLRENSEAMKINAAALVQQSQKLHDVCEAVKKGSKT